MTGPIIEVQSVSKRYRLGQFNAGSLREEAERLFRRRRSNGKADGMLDESEFWALKDVSFSVQPGEVLGIIGRNGAGKSTLLKILSRVTEPTSGEIRIRGRLASLLEVGTGFHPELTGRENIYLNGAILGMTRAEIKAKFDEIVAFSEVEKFLDTPVKRYSSGMYVRLAFAVAAHLEPEILIVDEVLAVGDVEFQKKCLGKMRDVSSREGRTVLFVSHNLGAINALCHRGVLLRGGAVHDQGDISQVVSSYIGTNTLNSESQTPLAEAPRSGGDQNAIVDAWIETDAGQVVQEVLMGQPITIFYRFEANRLLKNPRFGFAIEDPLGQRIYSVTSDIISSRPFTPARSGLVACRIPENRLLAGQYLISLTLAERDGLSVDYVERALPIHIIGQDIFGTGRMFNSGHGRVYIDAQVELRDCR
jgi:lipopolysaccharide transport system ATP-binding protein